MTPVNPLDTELRKLCTALEISEGFALYFVQCSVPNYCSSLTEQLQKECTKPIATFTIPPTLDILVDKWLNAQIQSLPAEAIIFLYGLERLLPTHDAESELIRHSTLQQLNWQRNAYERWQRSLVIWVPRYAMNLIARYASDFYDWRTAVFELTPPPASIQNSLQDFERVKVNNAVDGLTLEEKQRWLRVLKGLITELETAKTPPEQEMLAKLLTEEGELYYALADYPYAKSSFEKALTIRARVLGEQHPDYAESLNNLAGLYKATGQYEQALPLYERALEIRERVLGTDHPDTAISAGNLAGIYESKGDYDKALPLRKRALEIHERVLGTDHPDTATSLNNLALLYKATGQYEQALPLFQRALEIYERVLGKDHPLTATSLNNLAGLYDSTGQYEQALPLYERALEIRERVLGTDHPDTAQSLNNLAGLYKATGQYEQALPLYERALEIRERVLGKDHPDTATSLNNLAGLYKATGQYEQALPLYEHALTILKKTLGEQHPNTQTCTENYQELLMQMVSQGGAGQES